MAQTIQRAKLLSRFTCLGDRCEDTCCRGWSMQVDAPTFERYRERAPELQDAVEPEDGGFIMRKNPEGACVKLEGGLCGIQKKYGEGFLGDACHFYPRVIRQLGDRVVMGATMSCPEIARLALAHDDSCDLEEIEVDRLPAILKNILPDDVSSEDALAVHHAFLNAAQDKTVSAERIFLRIANASRLLDTMDKKGWAQLAGFDFANIDASLPTPQPNPNDPFNLLHALCGLMVASHKKPSERLQQTVGEMEKALAVTLDWQNVLIHTTDDSLPAFRRLQKEWKETSAAIYAPVLKRWLQMQLSLSLYPYGGLGTNLSERATIIGVRLATIKLAFMCSGSIYNGKLPQEVVIRLIQSISRFLDHLGDPAFSLLIYNETGWVKEDRMRGMLEQ